LLLTRKGKPFRINFLLKQIFSVCCLTEKNNIKNINILYNFLIKIGGFNMKKNDLTQYHDDTNLSLKRKMNKEVLEISSTGYGLEPVLETTEKEHTLEAKNHTDSSCGGL
jgi:hypothetical protein